VEIEAAVGNAGSVKNEPPPKTKFLVGGAIALIFLSTVKLWSTFELLGICFGIGDRLHPGKHR
jgi:hypothetical protein